MSLSAIIAAVVGLVVLIAGIFIGRPIGKSQGITEGAKHAAHRQEIIQAREAVKAVQGRANVETEVGAAAGDDLDDRLSKHSRPD